MATAVDAGEAIADQSIEELPGGSNTSDVETQEPASASVESSADQEAETQEPASDESQEQPEFNPATLARLGLSPEEAQQRFGTPEALASADFLISKQLFQEVERQQHSASQSARQAESFANFPAQQPATPQASQESTPEKFEVQLPDAFGEFEPEVQEAFKSTLNQMAEHFSHREQSLSQQLQQIHDHLISQENARWFDDLDAAYQGDDQLVEFMGGNTDQMDRTVDMLRIGYVGKNLPVPSTPELVAHAKEMVYGERLKHLAEQDASKRVTERLRDSQGRFSAKPDSRGDSPLTSEEKAEDKFAATFDRLADEGKVS